jgi:predicted RNA-binding Zn-ribbon protein involved in translation (DUF1610 family)
MTDVRRPPRLHLALAREGAHAPAMGMLVIPHDDCGAEPTSGQRSAPLPDRGDPTRPRCPRCGHQRHVHRFRYWEEHTAWTWHCANTSVRAVTHGPAAVAFCGYLWAAARPLPVCETCTGRLALELRAGELGYWCPTCQDVSH